MGFGGASSPNAYGFVNRRLTKQVMRYTYSAKALNYIKKYTKEGGKKDEQGDKGNVRFLSFG